MKQRRWWVCLPLAIGWLALPASCIVFEPLDELANERSQGSMDGGAESQGGASHPDTQRGGGDAEGGAASGSGGSEAGTSSDGSGGSAAGDGGTPELGGAAGTSGGNSPTGGADA